MAQGFGLRLLYLRNLKGFGLNHKRVYRIYRELELNLGTRPKKRIVREKPEALAVPQHSDATRCGRCISCMTNCTTAAASGCST
jgi:hypothetical protein